MNRKDISKDDDRKPKHDRALYKQRAVMVNHPKCVRKFHEYKVRKDAERADDHEKSDVRNENRKNKLAFSEWCKPFDLGVKIEEENALRKGNKARWPQKVNSWKNLGLEQCPWMKGFM